jgi:hypothetical protein
MAEVLVWLSIDNHLPGAIPGEIQVQRKSMLRVPA